MYTAQSTTLREPPGHAAVRFAALGDSITLGMGDRLPDGRWRGWAALLAECLAGPGRVRMHNLAVSGARSVDVAARQLPAALAVRPQVASVIVGVNDTLRDRFDLLAIGAALRATVAGLSDAGAVVLTARLPDPGRMLRLPASLARPLARRVHAINAVTEGIAARYGCVHVDLAGQRATYEPSMWSVDRLHPGERGHRLMAYWFAEALAARGYPVVGRPALTPDLPEPSRRAQAWWLATRGTGWVLGRCTDLVPGLVTMAAQEWWYGLRGAASRFDEQVGGEVAATLARLEAV